LIFRVAGGDKRVAVGSGRRFKNVALVPLLGVSGRNYSCSAQYSTVANGVLSTGLRWADTYCDTGDFRL
jgi:hypothetical protein